MKKLLSYTFALMLTLAFIAGPSGVLKASTASSSSDIKSYAVINIATVLSQSKAMDNIKKQVTYYKKKLTKESQKVQEQLKKDAVALQAKKPDLSAKSYQKAVATFRQKINKNQQALSAKNTKLDNSASKAVKVVEKRIAKLIQTMSNKVHYDIIYNASSLVFFQKDKDITKQVLNKLNAKLKKVRLSKPF